MYLLIMKYLYRLYQVCLKKLWHFIFVPFLLARLQGPYHSECQQLIYLVFKEVWMLKHSNCLLTGTSYIMSFLAACMISDKLILCTDNSPSIDYGDDDSRICWSDKLYLLPMTLATQSAGMKQ